MKNKHLSALWGAAYILCVLLGFVPQPAGILRLVLTILSLSFFAPGFCLLYRALRAGDRKTVKTLRILSAASLALTLLLLVCNFLSVLASPFVGNLCYALLVLVSAPMVASQ